MQWFDPRELAHRLGGIFSHVDDWGDKHTAVVDILAKAAKDLSAVIPAGPEGFQVADALAEAAKVAHRALNDAEAASKSSAPGAPPPPVAEPPAGEVAPSPSPAREAGGVARDPASPAPPA